MNKAKSSKDRLAVEAQASAALLSSEVLRERRKVLDVLKRYALQGADEFESYVTATEALLALAAGHRPGSISLARMQKMKVRGASTFYTYVLGLRPLIATENVDAIESATASWLTSKAPPTLRQAIAQAIGAVRSHHLRGELSGADYKALASIAKQGRP